MIDAALDDPLDALPPGAQVGIVSSGLRATAHLPLLVGRPVVDLRRAGGPAAVLVWGVGGAARRAEVRAAGAGLPLVRIEDPLYRSVGLGKEGAPALGLMVDRDGVAYDATRPSRLESLLASRGWETADLLAAAAALRARVVRERLTKYNIGRDRPNGDAAGRIVLVDQVAGDRSIAGAGADHATFMRMFKTAREAFAAERLIVSVHPDVMRGHARGHLLEQALSYGIHIVDEELSPHALLDEAAAIWTVSSQLGFDALLRGVPVATFGMPFYAGWGLGEDRATGYVVEAARRRRGVPRSVDELFAASVLVCSRWIDPVHREPCGFDRVIDRLVDWRERDRERAGRRVVGYGFTAWKRGRVTALIGGTATPVDYRYFWRPPPAKSPVRVAVWGMRDPPRFEARCRDAGHEFVRVEDGFIRSVGLGAGLLAAGSLVVDNVGLYYDATRPSALEKRLAAGGFDAALLARAAALRQRIVTAGVTKYNLGGDAPDLRAAADGRLVALVVGQVPGDQATRLGAGDFAGMPTLVAAARRRAPGAYLVFKEHPDIVAGHRRGHRREAEIAAIADLVLSDGDMAAILRQVDEAHVLSSLAGFEALLRGVPVVCWGRPFYAGWGLTTDMAAMPRRTRACTLDELVAASLVLYPSYAEPLTGIPVAVEDFLDALAASPRDAPPPQPWLHRTFLRARRAALGR